MKITLESTAEIGELEINGVPVPARIWKGETASGIRVLAFITRLAASGEDLSELDRELIKCPPPTIE